MKTDKQIISLALKTLVTEAESITHLKKYVGKSFVESVKVVFFSEGRVIVTGIGKSAIIAQKLVSTLNSTGTPSVFYARSRCRAWRPWHYSKRRCGSMHFKQR